MLALAQPGRTEPLMAKPTPGARGSLRLRSISAVLCDFIIIVPKKFETLENEQTVVSFDEKERHILKSRARFKCVVTVCYYYHCQQTKACMIHVLINLVNRFCLGQTSFER